MKVSLRVISDRVRKAPKGMIRGLLSAFTFALLIVAGTQQAFSQVVSNGTGGGAWTSGTTWVGGVAPASDSSSNVVIAPGDSVWTDPANRVGCTDLDVKGKLNVLAGGISVKGNFTIEAGAFFYDSYSSLKSWPGEALSYTIDPASTFVLTSAASSTFGSNDADSTFGNVVILKSGSSCAANLTINGDLVINTAGTGNTFRGISATTGAGPSGPSLVHTVKGNVNVISGQWSAVDANKGTVPLYCTWNIDGNVTVGDRSTAATQSRMGPVSSADVNGAFGTFNIKGNLSFINGARLQAGSSTSSTNIDEVGIINVGGDFLYDTTAICATNSLGSFAINFKGTKPQTVTLNAPVSFSSSTMTATLFDTVAAGANVTFTGGKSWRTNIVNAANGTGEFVVNGTLNFGPDDTLRGHQNFILNPGGTLGIGSPYGIVSLSDPMPDSGNIQTDSGRVYSSGATYAYNGTAAQVTGSGFPASVYGLTVTDTAGVTLGASETVTGKLTLSGGGKLHLGSNTLYVSSKKANAVVGDSVSYVVGSFTRADSATGSYQFPIGDGTAYHGVTLNFTTAPTASSDLMASFTAADPTSAGLPVGIGSYWNGGYWTLSATGTPTGTYNLTVYAKGTPGIDTGSVSLIGKPSLSVPWLALNTSATHSSTVSGNFITESAVTTYGIVGIGYGRITGVLEKKPGIPTTISLGNYPNPFNPSTNIQFGVPKSAHVTLTIYNDLGQKVATLVDQNMTPGIYNRVFDGSALSSGVYFSRLTVDAKTIVTKMLMLK